jgi:uncharacterized protein YecT (DUF1311 family)
LNIKRLVISICALLACGFPSAGAADDFTGIGAELEACLAKNGSTPWVDSCNAAAKTAADKRLNQVYDAWVARLRHPSKKAVSGDGEILRRLVTAERAWIDYRDKDCDLQSTSMLGGTGESNVYGHCLYIKTKERVKALEDLQ